MNQFWSPASRKAEFLLQEFVANLAHFFYEDAVKNNPWMLKASLTEGLFYKLIGVTDKSALLVGYVGQMRTDSVVQIS